MPRPARPAATVSMNGWLMPAPAPWANTKHATARAGFVSNAETEPALPASIERCCVLMAVIVQASLAKIGSGGKRHSLEFRGVEFSHRRHATAPQHPTLTTPRRLRLNQRRHSSRRRPAVKVREVLMTINARLTTALLMLAAVACTGPAAA